MGGRAWVIVAGLTVAVVACGGGESSRLTGETSPTALMGPTWRLTQINGQPPVDGASVTAEFSSDGRVAGRSGCNLYMGSARVEAEGRLAVGLLASTMMACAPQGVMEQEARFLSTLQAATRFVIAGGELRLGPAAAGTTLVFSSR